MYRLYFLPPLSRFHAHLLALSHILIFLFTSFIKADNQISFLRIDKALLYCIVLMCLSKDTTLVHHC